jgi:hypothetical protein
MESKENIEEPSDTTGNSIEDNNYFKGFIDNKYAIEPYAKQKYIALYKARLLLAQIGSMEERRICAKKLKIMKKIGLKAV